MTNLGNKVGATVEDPNDVMNDFTSLRLYRRSSRSGVDGLVTTLPLVADTASYSYQDENGALTDWYDWTYYSTVTLLESPHTEPVAAAQAQVYTRLTLRRKSAFEMGCFGVPEGDYIFPGPSGTTTTNGTTTTVVCSTYADSLYPSYAFRGWYLDLPSAERRVLSMAAGTFTLTRALTDAAHSLSGLDFDLYAQLPAEGWNQAMFGDGRGAFAQVWVPFSFPIAGVPASDDGFVQTEYALPNWIAEKDQVLRAAMQSQGALRSHRLSAGVEYEVIEREGGGCTLYLSGGLAEQNVILLEGMRRMAPMAADADSIALNDSQVSLFMAATCVRVLEDLVQDPYLEQRDMRRWEGQLRRHTDRFHGLVQENSAWRSLVNPVQTRQAYVTGQLW